ncbi:GtrA family protein [Lysinibacter sp. HNR]|uniref:GtrA family protein n=1 Tax=Lysinibacter sp. HNR TaxID=3031408 RepID=UPI002434B4F2|nr:GtrA family protein [Lysinibacter sp. HNR]WGD38063.1 GtrA family protein [Lysinibacter sp. HNR]
MSLSKKNSEMVKQIIRFIIVGGSNTLVTYAIFIGLGIIIAPWAAYTIAFIIGLAWVTFGSSRIVFRAKAQLRQMTLFAVWYLFIFGIGQLIIRIIEPQGFIELAMTSLTVLLFTTPLTFIGGKFLFREPKEQLLLPERRES